MQMAKAAAKQWRRRRKKNVSVLDDKVETEAVLCTATPKQWHTQAHTGTEMELNKHRSNKVLAYAEI